MSYYYRYLRLESPSFVLNNKILFALNFTEYSEDECANYKVVCRRGCYNKGVTDSLNTQT